MGRRRGNGEGRGGEGKGRAGRGGEGRGRRLRQRRRGGDGGGSQGETSSREWVVDTYQLVNDQLHAVLEDREGEVEESDVGDDAMQGERSTHNLQGRGGRREDQKRESGKERGAEEGEWEGERRE
jgi:hypothetical protein